MSECWRIELFGHLRASREEYRVTRFRSRKTGSLLGYLARYPDRLHSREVLAETLWPGCASGAARASLSTALWSLRRQFGGVGKSGGIILADRETVGLAPSAVETDVADFLAQVAGARGAENADHRRFLEAAAQLYTGEFMLGYYEDWVEGEQHQLAETFHEVLSELINILEDAGDLHRAIEYAARGVQADPLREETHRQLIRLHIAAGHTGQAIRRYRQMERLLLHELGVAPSPDTRALLEGLNRTGDSNQVRRPRRAPSRAGPQESKGTFTVLLVDRGGGALETPKGAGAARLLREVRRRGGFEFEGIVFSAAFPCAEAALDCALALRRTCTADNGQEVQRMALDTGRLEWQDGIPVGGPVLQSALCVLRAVPPGCILCSDCTRGLASRDLNPGIRLRDLGLYRLGAEERPERLFSVEVAENAPVRLVPRATSVHRGMIPAPVSRFVGRTKELARLERWFDKENARLVTILGTSGMGKTRLALAAAERLLESYHGAVWFVSLADVTDPVLVPAAILHVLQTSGAREEDPFGRIVEIVEPQPALLVLDNFEHLLPEGARFVTRLLQRIDSLHCLITSRRVLSISGEHRFHLGPLPVPEGDETPEGLMRYPSAQLFVDRMQSTLGDFRITPDNVRAATRLCRGLEGIPLSLELAAARADSLTPLDMEAALRERFRFLVSRAPSSRPERHRSIQAALDCTLSTLSPPARRLFGRLAIFRGGFTLDAVEGVCRDPLAADHLAELIESSLVAGETRGRQRRFSLLETFREYGRENLSPAQWHSLQKRHAAWFRDLAETAEEEIEGPAQTVWLERLDADLGNLRAAVAWTLEERPTWSMRIAGALGHFWEVRGRWEEGVSVLRAALERAPRARKSLRMGALHQIGWLLYLLGNVDDGRANLEVALELAEGEGETGRACSIRYALAMIAGAQKRSDVARRLHEQCLAIGRENNFLQVMARAFDGLGNIAEGVGDFELARRHYGASLTSWRKACIPRGIAVSLMAMAKMEKQMENDLAAERFFRESLDIFRTLGDLYSAACQLEELGRMSLRKDKVRQARDELSEAVAMFRKTDSKQKTAETLQLMGRAMTLMSDHAQARKCFVECRNALRVLHASQKLAGLRHELNELAERQTDPVEAVHLFALAESTAVAPEAATDVYQGRLTRLRDELGESVFAAAWAEGSARPGPDIPPPGGHTPPHPKPRTE
ncbi:MAG: hypothetical protein GXP31_07235 [Kiritimatiellaeota bacterium]|nr:hypothetical protein [Kiritimatiellota bacterium]